MNINIGKVMIIIAQKGMIYKDFCEKAGITEQGFRMIRSGKRKPKPATIGKIATALNVDIREIILLEGESDG